MKEVLIHYTFDAPIDMVFEAWTDPEQLLEWFAPEGCNIIYKKIELYEGGEYLSCLKNPQYGDCWCKGKYISIDAPHTFIFTMVITNANGDDVNPVDVGMSADWPASTTVKISFNEENGKTKMTLHQTVDEAIAKQTGAHPSWIEMFNKLNKKLQQH